MGSRKQDASATSDWKRESGPPGQGSRVRLKVKVQLLSLTDVKSENLWFPEGSGTREGVSSRGVSLGDSRDIYGAH